MRRQCSAVASQWLLNPEGATTTEAPAQLGPWGGLAVWDESIERPRTEGEVQLRGKRWVASRESSDGIDCSGGKGGVCLLQLSLRSGTQGKCGDVSGNRTRLAIFPPPFKPCHCSHGVGTESALMSRQRHARERGIDRRPPPVVLVSAAERCPMDYTVEQLRRGDSHPVRIS
jgi:hypothetical protein